jgi:hypothetical protein
MPDLSVAAQLEVDAGGGTTRQLSVNDFTAPATGAATEITQTAILASLDHLIAVVAAHASQTFVQSSPSAIWVIVHNMGGHPTVTVVDSGGTLQLGGVTYDSDAQVTVTFSAPFSGKAYLSL